MKAILRSGFLALVFLLATACSENAGPYENGLAAYQRGDYATALHFWRPLAERGVAQAQNNLGLMYANGHGVPQDDAEAVTWFRLAAEQGDVYKQHKLDADAQLQIGIKEDRQGLPASDGSTPYIKPKPKTVKTIRVRSDGKPIPE